MRSSQNAPCTDFRFCKVALLGHHLRSARHGSRGEKFFHFGVYVSTKTLVIYWSAAKPLSPIFRVSRETSKSVAFRE